MDAEGNSLSLNIQLGERIPGKLNTPKHNKSELNELYYHT